MRLAALFLLAIVNMAVAQNDVPGPTVFHPGLVIRVQHARLTPAHSSNAGAILSAGVAALFPDPEICCDKDSALAYRLAPGGYNLEQVSARLQGKHTLKDGRSVTITTDLVSPNSMTPDQIILPLAKGQLSLIEWNSHIYVLYGARYDESLFYDGHREWVIHTLLLFDPQGAGSSAVFDRQKDDWKNVQGLLRASAIREQN